MSLHPVAQGRDESADIYRWISGLVQPGAGKLSQTKPRRTMNQDEEIQRLKAENESLIRLITLMREQLTKALEEVVRKSS
jgi:hypothetical protein